MKSRNTKSLTKEDYVHASQQKTINSSGRKLCISNGHSPIGLLLLKAQDMFQQTIAFDVLFTKKIAICSNSKGKFGFIRPLLIVLEWSCHGVPWLVGNIGAIFISHDIHMQEILLNFFLALVLDLMILGSLKVLVRRKRPLHNLNDMFATVSVDKYSFPSGHSTRAALIVAFMTSHLNLCSISKFLIWCWAFTISLSRVLLGRHHILDVTIGLLIGIMESFLAKWLWLPKYACLILLKPIHEDLHL